MCNQINRNLERLFSDTTSKKFDSSIHSFENMYNEIQNRFLEKNYINGRNHKIVHKQRSGYLLINLHDKRLITELSMVIQKKMFLQKVYVKNCYCFKGTFL